MARRRVSFDRYVMTVKAIATCLLALTSVAAADRDELGAPPPPGRPRLVLPSSAPAKRKPASVRYAPEALSRFVDALMLDKAGDLREAARMYEKANEAGPQANTFYNLADVERRRERYKDALEAYAKYLELAPDAPDRKEVERAMQALKTTPFVAVIDGATPDAIVLVDGVLIGPSPVVIQLAAGRHHVDRISPTGYRGTSVTAKPGDHDHMVMNPIDDDEPNTGNVVLAGSPAIRSMGGWKDSATGIEYRIPERFALEPGHYETDLFGDRRACDKIVFDVPRTKGLFYVYVDAKPPAKPGGCIPLKIRTQILDVRP